MRYLTPPTKSPRVLELMRAGVFGCMTTPRQGSLIPDGVDYFADNGKFGKGWPGAEAWFAWLTATVNRYGPERCLGAVAPDAPFDATGTLAMSLPWLTRIRELGIPAAFATQDGSEAPGMIPWDDIDVVFLAGSTEWKLSRHAAAVAAEGKHRGLKVHMGRVNSETRLRHAVAIDCDTADGTFIVFAPDTNTARVERWLARFPKRQPPHVEFPLFDIVPEEVPIGVQVDRVNQFTAYTSSTTFREDNPHDRQP